MKDYPGRPPEGKVLWGASLGSQDPITRHDEPAGTLMELRRLFYVWSNYESGWAMRQVRENVEAGRFVWVSFKLPGSWVQVAAGQYDLEIRRMLTELEGLGVPIWLTMHHEPEGGGGSNAPDESSGHAGHKAMNTRVRDLMTDLGTQNIALSLVLMGWTWDEASQAYPGDPNRNPDNWWDGDVYDFIGVDPYVNKTGTMLTANWFRIEAWAVANGVDIGVAEWGLKGEDVEAAGYVREFYEHAVAVREPRVTSQAYFDVPGEWHQGEWYLKGLQLDQFHEIMQESAAFVPEVPEPVQTFEDVPPDYLFFKEIEWFAQQGITRGCNPPANDLFCPKTTVTREQMAAFMYRAAHGGTG